MNYPASVVGFSRSVGAYSIVAHLDSETPVGRVLVQQSLRRRFSAVAEFGRCRFMTRRHLNSTFALFARAKLPSFPGVPECPQVFETPRVLRGVSKLRNSRFSAEIGKTIREKRAKVELKGR